jgi:hypothetical protein
MNFLVFLIEQIATGLYIFTAVAIVLTWRNWMRSRREFRATYFELERDIARYQQANAVTALVLLVEFALIILGVQRVVAPFIREKELVPQQAIAAIEDGIFDTPTPAFQEGAEIDASGVQLGATDPAQRVLATPTLTPTPVGTIIPNAPPPDGCDTPDATLQVPANGMVVFEPINVIGAANTQDFAFYRFELRGPQTFGNFAILSEYTIPVSDIGELGQIVPAFYEPGDYQFRLTVFDITNTLKARCMVNIFISEPIPTPTPLGE